MKTETPIMKTNLLAKSALARLMAAENITVEIDAKAPTASFNMEDRRLTLPLWEVEGDSYDMLVGHEVSHALYTPAGREPLMTAIETVAGGKKNFETAKQYLNIVEDARIERLIKVDYPGLRRSFAAGYREFMIRDLFQVKGKEVATMAFIDRINLQYKIGWLMEVPFSVAELSLAQRVATTRTWSEVVTLTKEIYDFAKAQQEAQPPQPKEEKQKQKPEEGGEGLATDQQEEEDEDGETDSQSSSSDEGEDEDEGGKSEGGESDAEGEESKGDSAGAEDDADSDEGGAPSAGAGTGKEKSDAAPAPSQTEKALSDSLQDMTRKGKTPEIVYADLPTLPENLVVPFSRMEQAYADSTKTMDSTVRDVPERVYGVWKTKNSSDVLALATEFERRKAADAHRRTMTADTGALDPTRLFAYKTSDDIFLRASTVMDGKNHGLVILLDMSGSMCDQMLDTVVQLVNLTAFARRVNIPFKVYGFVDTAPEWCMGEECKWGVNPTARAKWTALNSDTTGTHFRLLTLLESGITQMRFQKAAGALLAWGAALNGAGFYGRKGETPKQSDYAKALNVSSPYYSIAKHYDKNGLHLNGTPTNQALIALLTLVPQFKAKHGLQVVNTIVLTDGQAGDRPLCHQGINRTSYESPLIVIRDPVTRREYKAWTEYKSEYADHHHYNEFGTTQQSELLVGMLRERTGSKVININLTNGVRSATRVIESKYSASNDPKQVAAKKQFIKDGWVALPENNGFNEEIVLNTSNAAESEFDFDSVSVNTDSNKGVRDLNKAFCKSLESRKGNRPLMARIAELISKNF